MVGAKKNDKPEFGSIYEGWTREYECEEYKCHAHPRSCLFCDHCTDVFFDYTAGPWGFVCDISGDTDAGMFGKCENFMEEKI